MEFLKLRFRLEEIISLEVAMSAHKMEAGSSKFPQKKYWSLGLLWPRLSPSGWGARDTMMVWVVSQKDHWSNAEIAPINAKYRIINIFSSFFQIPFCLNFKKSKLFSHIQFFVTPWIVACQAPLSTGFLRQEYWSGLPFPSPGDLRDPGMEPRSPALQVDPLTPEPPGKCQLNSRYTGLTSLHYFSYFKFPIDWIQKLSPT